jgi:hypothetical protein
MKYALQRSDQTDSVILTKNRGYWGYEELDVNKLKDVTGAVDGGCGAGDGCGGTGGGTGDGDATGSDASSASDSDSAGICGMACAALGQAVGAATFGVCMAETMGIGVVACTAAAAVAAVAAQAACEGLACGTTSYA